MARRNAGERYSTRQLGAEVSDVFDDLRHKKVSPEAARVAAYVAERVLKTYVIDIEYRRVRGSSLPINELEEARGE